MEAKPRSAPAEDAAQVRGVKARRLTVGIDVGGTFTDVFIKDGERPAWAVRKVPSTPPAFAEGFLHGLSSALQQAGGQPAEVARVIHGTTVATNCILTQSGARLGFLLTEGFRDILYVGIGWRPRMYDLDMDPVEPLFLAPRRRSLGVRERIDAKGGVVTPLDEAQLLETAAELVEGQGAEVLVVCYLHAYANPSHERRTKELLAQRYPALPVTLSSEVLPRRREYRRLVVSGFDGYVKPVVNNYLGGLVERLRSAGVPGQLHVMQSHGGVCGVENVIERPVGTVLSGLAAGVIGAANVGAGAGCPDLISLDMGGTSTDVALIRDGQPLVSNDGGFEDYPLNVPMVDVRTIGAGGSSIAQVDAGGGLRVGPDSAGAEPGPACYGRGGALPTVTDASFVLGYLNPATFAGGIDIDIDKAAAALHRHLAAPLGLSLVEAALGVHAIVNANMADALRLVSIRRGHDPRDFVLLPFGGAGPLNAGRVAEACGMKRILVPPTPGVLSALGLMLAPTRHEAMASYDVPAASARVADMAAILAGLDRECRRRMRVDGVDPAACSTEYFAEMRYVGQSHELEVALGGAVHEGLAAAAEAAFHQVHGQTYNHSDAAVPTEFVALRAVHQCPPPESRLLEPQEADAAAPPPQPSFRPACLSAAAGHRDIPVYQREALPVGFQFPGPAIVEQADTTTLIYPGHWARVDSFANILVEVGADEA